MSGQRFGFVPQVSAVRFSLRVCIMVKVLLPLGGSLDLIPATTESSLKELR